MEQSILKSTKKLMGVSEDDASFDLELITYINSAFSTLTDIGVGPLIGFVIEDDTAVWSDYIDPDHDEIYRIKLSKVKTIVALHTRLRFDPPTSGFLLDAMKASLQEELWRLNVNREEVEYVDPNPPVMLIVDGGDPSGNPFED